MHIMREHVNLLRLPPGGTQHVTIIMTNFQIVKKTPRCVWTPPNLLCRAQRATESAITMTSHLMAAVGVQIHNVANYQRVPP